MKKMTIKYWNSLSEGSRERALRAVYPNNPSVVKMMASEKPDLKHAKWKLAFSMIGVSDSKGYKTCVNRTYYA